LSCIQHLHAPKILCISIGILPGEIEPRFTYLHKIKKAKGGGKLGDFTYIDYLAKFGLGGAHPGGFNLSKEMLANEHIRSGSKILDAGCGTGQTAAYLFREYQADVTGLDIHPIMIEKARNRFLSEQLPVRLVAGSVEKLPFEDNTFDFVLSESVLAFVHKPSSLAEIYRVLKKGGRFIANEMTVDRKLTEEEQSEIKNFYQIDILLAEQDWKKLLETAGFRNIKVWKENLAVSGYTHSEYHFSTDLEPELFSILTRHGNLVSSYHDALSYRILTGTK